MPHATASELLGMLEERRWTLAVAEAACGGLLAARFVDVPGASVVFAGGVVAYGHRAKESLLAVPRAVLDEHGSVHAQVALAMAKGARWRLGADVAIAETGVAGPQAAHASPKAAGTVALAVITPEREASATRALAVRDRAHARAAFVDEALALLEQTLSVR